METGIFEKVGAYDVGKVLVVGDVLSEFYHRDGHKQKRKVADCRAVEHEVADEGRAAFDDRAACVNLTVSKTALGDGFEEGEFRIVEEAFESERAEAVDDRREVDDSHTHTEFAVVDITERGDYERKPESRADTHDERYKFDALSAFNRRYDDRDESEQSYEYVPEVVFASAVLHHPAACGAGKRKSDDREDRSDDYVREEFFDPAGAYEFYYERDDYVYESRKRYADNKSPVAEVTRCRRTERA